MKISFNNNLILETYKGKRELKANVTNGFAMVAQKVSLHPLKVLVDAKLADGTLVKKGSTAFIKEELLFGQAWAKKEFDCPILSESFIIAQLSMVDFIDLVE